MSTDLVPTAEAACEGPLVEVMLSFGHWLESRGLGGPDKITVFTPGETIAEDAGQAVVEELLGIAGSLGYHYVNQTKDIKAITADGIKFAKGTSIEAELKIIFPDWQAHHLLRDLPIFDDRGFVLTDMMARNPRYPNVFACGDGSQTRNLGALGRGCRRSPDRDGCGADVAGKGQCTDAVCG